MLKRLLNPKYVIVAILVISVIAALLAFGNIQQVLRNMADFPRVYLLWIFLLMCVYEFVRYLQWHFLLRSLGICPSWRIQCFAYLTSEFAKLVPIGNYFENYILERAEGTDIGRSSAATTYSVLIEVGVSLLGVVILGLGSWTAWLRPTIVIGLLIFGLLAWLVSRRHRSRGLPDWVMRRHFAVVALRELRRFARGAHDLLNARVISIATAFGAVYLVIGGATFYLVALGLGVRGIGLGDALSVYFFSLAFSLIFPLPVDIGVLEFSATGAWLALGLSKTSAVSIVLTNRVVTLGATLVIAGTGMAILHDDLRLVLRGSGTRGAPALDGDDEGWCPPHQNGVTESTDSSAQEQEDIGPAWHK